MKRLVLAILIVILVAVGVGVPKKREGSRLFPASPLARASNAGATVATAETVFSPFTSVEVLDKFVTNANQGYTSETTLLTGVLRMPGSWDPVQGEELQEAIVDFWLSGIFSSDAAAGTTTVRVRVDGTELLATQFNEANNMTSQPATWLGSVLLGPSDAGAGSGTDANASVMRTNAQGLTPSGNTAVANFAGPSLDIDYNSDITITVTIQTTDAGTSLDECHGWMKVTYRGPLGDGV